MRTLVAEYVAHYHLERPPQALSDEQLVAPEHRTVRDGTVRRRQRLGGLLHLYERAAG